jgi:DNA-binding MarR family transcriptional regulator
MATAPVPDEALDQREADGDSEKLKVVHKRALKRFDDTVMPQQEQRALCLAARRFASIPGAQWEGEWGDPFENSIKPEINKVAVGLEKIYRDYRENRIVPDFRPAGQDSDQDTADTLDGIHRADSYYFKAGQARDNAFEEAASGGMGAYRLTNEWADPYDKESDAQRINPAMTIVDADQRVFFDGNSKLYDKSDARFCFVLTGYTPDAFREAFGEERETSWADGLPRVSTYDWFAPEAVVVSEYYEVEDKDERLLIFEHRLTTESQRWWSSDIDAAEIEDLTAKGWVQRSRRQKRRRIHKYTMSGAEVLRDNGFIAGECIPVVPVYGKRWYIDGQERFRGYVQLMMDRQRVYNAQIAKLSETSALSPREKPIFAAAQMPPHLAEQWAAQEINRHPYALVEPLINPVTGEVVALGPIGKIDPPQLAPVSAVLLQITGSDLTEDMADPDEVVANTSAEAMDIAATRVDAKSGIYLDNMRQSVQREGEIYLSMCKEIYWEPGRKVETMTEDGDDGEATLLEGVNDKNGAYRIRNDFTNGRYKVIADVTEATSTRRDKTVRSSLNIAAKAVEVQDMELAQAALITAVMNQDGEGMADMQRFARKKGLAIGLIDPNEEEQEAMAEAAQGQQPDASQKVLEAQAEALHAQAGRNVKEAEKIDAEVGLTEAKTIETLANAKAKGADSETRRFAAMRPANDAETPRPKIRMGRDF